MTSLVELVEDRRIVICTGTGGVGKTTTAAVLALEAARRGRRAVVVTIDPAKRLADTLGLGELSNTPSLIEGDWPGELWAMMLDTKTTFDELIATYAADGAQAERILGNRFYRNISGALSGTQEYMAGEKLHELHESGRFDLVVVDTPPTRHALDFLDAPARLTRFLDHKLYRALMTPTKAYLKAVNVAATAVAKAIGKVVGGEALEDGLSFFAAFEGMEQGFRDRAARVQALLTDPATAYVLVASPRADTVAEATYFAERLAQSALPVAALVVNRVHPRFGKGLGPAARKRATAAVGTPLEGLARNLAQFRTMADGEERHLVDLAERVQPAPVARVPFLPHDVHDLDTLAEIASYLF
ncbi:MAG: putative anion transporting ATPase [Actinomycetia bacterium]|nr:putative anion transporting ATPase [Actinomycetes bacterium]